MYWILAIMAAIAATIIALVVGGLVTPREYLAARYIRVSAPTAAVRTLLADIGGYDAWVGAPLSIASRPPLLDDADISLTVTDDDTGVQRDWAWRVSTDDSAGDSRTTVITLRERGVIANPIVRFFASFRGHAGAVERTLGSLAQHLGEDNVTIEREPA